MDEILKVCVPYVSMSSARYYCQILMKLIFSADFRKILIRHEYPSSGAELFYVDGHDVPDQSRVQVNYVQFTYSK